MKFIQQDLLWNLQIDTYKREIEHYGIHTIELSEHLFYLESTFFLEIYPFIKDKIEKKQHWILVLKLIDTLLESFHYKLEDKVRLFKILKEGIGKVYGMNRSLKKQLDIKFRKEKKYIEEGLGNDITQDEFLILFTTKIEEYKHSIIIVTNEIVKQIKKYKLNLKLDYLLQS